MARLDGSGSWSCNGQPQPEEEILLCPHQQCETQHARNSTRASTRAQKNGCHILKSRAAHTPAHDTRARRETEPAHTGAHTGTGACESHHAPEGVMWTNLCIRHGTMKHPTKLVKLVQKENNGIFRFLVCVRVVFFSQQGTDSGFIDAGYSFTGTARPCLPLACPPLRPLTPSRLP